MTPIRAIAIGFCLILAGNPLLKAGDLEMIQRRNALQLFPRLGQPRAAAG